MNHNPERKIVESWLSDISASLGFELNLDEEGTCAFQVGSDTLIGIEISKEFPVVYLSSPLLAIPTDKDQSLVLMAQALELNAFQVETRGGAVALAPGRNLLMYCYTVPIEGTHSEDFSKILGGFYESISSIKSRLTGFPSVEENVKGKEWMLKS